MMTITKKDNQTFEVFVPADEDTTHIVTVSDAYYEELSNKKIDKQELVRLSFMFLLGRESNNEIMREFDLSIIPTYFSEYEKTIRKIISA